MLAYLLVVFWTERRRTQLTIVLIVALLTVAIGVSRLYLGVHYSSDVVAGYAVGLLWLSACITGLEMARRSVVQRGHGTKAVESVFRAGRTDCRPTPVDVFRHRPPTPRPLRRPTAPASCT
jgi:hypothetical protein